MKEEKTEDFEKIMEYYNKGKALNDLEKFEEAIKNFDKAIELLFLKNLECEKDEKGYVLMGTVGVDSGQLMICDPTYLEDWDKNDKYDFSEDIYDKPEFRFGYNYVSKKEGKLFKEIPYEMGHMGRAICFQSGLGDGVYEVWGKIEEVENWGKRLTEVLIKML